MVRNLQQKSHPSLIAKKPRCSKRWGVCVEGCPGPQHEKQGELWSTWDSSSILALMRLWPKFSHLGDLSCAPRDVKQHPGLYLWV